MNRTQLANKLLELLAEKHAGDVFVPECKDGPTHGASHLRMDAWVMRKSWSKPLTIAYEIKTSRADFMSDEKWRFYLGLCNEFYFVAPSGMIRPDELPPEAGLLVGSKNLARLFRKKKASYRTPDIPEDLWRYIVMCRSRIDIEHRSERTDNLEFWQGWLEHKELSHEVGWRVSKALKKLIAAKIDAVESEQAQLKKENDNLAEVAAFLKRIGLSPRWTSSDSIQRRIGQAVPSDLRYAVKHALRALETLQTELNAIDEQAAKRVQELTAETA